MGFLEDSGLETFPTKHLHCKMKHAPELFKETIRKATSVSRLGYAIRARAVSEFRTFSDHQKGVWDKRFERAAQIESELENFLNPGSEDAKKLQEDAFAQLSFQDQYFKSLNFVPFVLFTITMFKVWVVPCMALLTPLIAWIVPYLFIKFLYKLPISQEQYAEIVKMLWTGSPLDFIKDPKGALKSKLPSSRTIRSVFQSALMAFSFIQGLIQPIQNAYHLYKTDRIIMENGKKLIELEAIYDSFERDADALDIKLQFRSSIEDIRYDDPRLALQVILDQPERYSIVMRDLAELELYWRIANCANLRPALLIEHGPYPLFQADNIYDVSLGDKAVGSSISFTGKSHHAALTGPNGGGKSSFLRAVLQCVLLAQTYGVAPAEKLILRRFGWICSGLRLQDAPGDLSMFETEVWFAANLLKDRRSRGPGLVLYDELFHSTNPPDGIRTAELFLKQLWAKKTVVSIISTHVFSLVEEAPADVQRLCCNAREVDGVVKFAYAVQEGICRVSSVKNIWDRFGLSIPAIKVPVENLPTQEK